MIKKTVCHSAIASGKTGNIIFLNVTSLGYTQGDISVVDIQQSNETTWYKCLKCSSVTGTSIWHHGKLGMGKKTMYNLEILYLDSYKETLWIPREITAVLKWQTFTNDHKYNIKEKNIVRRWGWGLSLQ